MTNELDRLAPHLDTIAGHAGRVDREGAFPQHTVEALRATGLLGLLTPTEHGGLGQGHAAAARVVAALARVCGSSAMVACMHYSAAIVLARYGSAAINRELAAGRHLATLAFSEEGSRGQFWAPVSTARADGDGVVLDARKSFATSARHATIYVWSSRPAAAEGLSTLWLVPARTPGLSIPAAFDGLGLRGNDSAALVATGARLPADARLGADGEGFAAMMGSVLPMFNVLSAACSTGLMHAALEKAADHLRSTTFTHSGTQLRDLPTARAYLAKARTEADMAEALLHDTVAALEAGRPDATLRVLQVKAAAADAALSVVQACMRVCGGAAFRKELGLERSFRDAQAAAVMSPTSDMLYDFVGKALTGMDVF